MKRITVDLEDELFMDLKIIAARRNTTLSRIVRHCIYKRVMFDKQFLEEENDSANISTLDTELE